VNRVEGAETKNSSSQFEPAEKIASHRRAVPIAHNVAENSKLATAYPKTSASSIRFAFMVRGGSFY
jgi:hypothetical protein